MFCQEMTTAPHDAWNILFEKKLFVRAETKRKLIPGNSVYQGGVEGCVCVLQAHVKCGQIGLILKRLDDKNYYKSWPIFWLFFAILKNFTVGTLRLLFCKIGLIFTPASGHTVDVRKAVVNISKFQLKMLSLAKRFLVGLYCR